MFRHGAICSSIDSCQDCGTCNTTALDLNKIKILQSPLYRTLKDSAVVRNLRKHHRDGYLSESTADDSALPVGTPEDFKNLRSYYESMLSLMDVIHFNSTVTKSAYNQVFKLPVDCVIPISHADIADYRKEKKFSTDQLRIRYLGPYGRAKGFFLLKAALDKLWDKRQDFYLDVHFTPPQMSPYMKTHNRYNYSELEGIFDQTDVLVVPSVWYETFGYTALEALSYGVPVIMSSTVGAKDILTDGVGIVIEDITAEKLLDILNTLSVEELQKMNHIIARNQNIMTLRIMSWLIEKKCYR
jgi:glycosyltransferase involved in cell wall biosynthesis